MPPASLVPIRIAAAQAIEYAQIYLESFPVRLGKDNLNELLQQDRLDYEDTLEALNTIGRIARGQYVAAAKNNPRDYLDCSSGDLIKLLNYGELNCNQRTGDEPEPAFKLIRAFAEEYGPAIMRQAIKLEQSRFLPETAATVAQELVSQVRRFRKMDFDPGFTIG